VKLKTVSKIHLIYLLITNSITYYNRGFMGTITILHYISSVRIINKLPILSYSIIILNT